MTAKIKNIIILASSVALSNPFVSGLRVRSFTKMISKVHPPIAKIVPTNVYFGVDPENPDRFKGESPMSPPKIKVDPYFWLRDDDRENKEVLEYLKAENEYTTQVQLWLSL